MFGAVGIAVVANYASWLGPHEHYEIGSDGFEHGPYQPWQVIGLVVVLTAIVIIAGWQRMAIGTASTVAVAMTVAFAYYADKGPASFWIFGAILVAVGSFLGSLVVASLTTRVSKQVAVRRALRDEP